MPMNGRYLRSKNPIRIKSTPLACEQLEARMLMAIDMLVSQIELDTQLSSQPAVELSQSAFTDGLSSLRSLAITRPGGQSIQGGQRLILSTNTLQLQAIGLDPSGLPLNSPVRVSWIISSQDPLARATIRSSANLSAISFNRPAEYSITARTGWLTTRFIVQVSPEATSLRVFNSNNNSLIQNNGLVSTAGTTQSFTVVGFAENGQATQLNEEARWSLLTGPADSSPEIRNQGNRATIHFDRAGLYSFQVSSGELTSRVRINVVGVLGAIAVTPENGEIQTGTNLQLTATAFDQFNRPFSHQPNVAWSSSGGNITPTGLFQAGHLPGAYSVTARIGHLAAQANITVTSSTNDHSLPSDDGAENPTESDQGANGGSETDGPQDGVIFTTIQDENLRGLITEFYADGSINREEMIELLRAAGQDNVITAAELADLRFIVSADSPFEVPKHVRGLAQNLLHNNPANLRFRGQSAGNLSPGSTGNLLNQLIDKWFFGADVPTLTSPSLTYRFAVGNLFGDSPGLADSRQGMLGDCYFLASLVSIAEINPAAIADMFIENGDGTFTVRFFGGPLGMFWQGGLISAGFVSGSGVADFVTVNRQLPTFSNGILAYSGYGQSALNSSTSLWLALAEKAYAQWNETGRSGRNGTNTYAGIEGGWMTNVNAQVLGVNSTYYIVNSSSRQAMLNALAAGQAVTIGTNPTASLGGLVGSHAYVVTGYNSSSDTFVLYNTWSTHHPTPLTWAQLQTQTSAFVVADPSGNVALELHQPGLNSTTAGQRLVYAKQITVLSTDRPHMMPDIHEFNSKHEL
jgi:hypothetical protein